MFIQPDWFEVTKAGVGTNRYAYSFNDPVNNRDKGGNYFESLVDIAFIAYDLVEIGVQYSLTGSVDPISAAALAADLVSLAVPVATGGGLAVRAAASSTKKSARGVLGHQTHHVMPQSLSNHPALSKTGYDIQSSSNKIDLPTTRPNHPTRTVHRGKHTKDYEERFSNMLDAVSENIDSGTITPQRGKQIIDDFVATERQGLRRGQTQLNKASVEAPPAKSSDGKPPSDNGPNSNDGPIDD